MEQYVKIEGSASPTLNDRPHLPYCKVTMMEIQRMSCAFPSGLDHIALQDTTLGGYMNKDTHMFFNIWKFHHDPEYFPDPWTFKPERFLSANRSSIITNGHFVPFGFGKRKCIGEPLAKEQLLLFFTILVQSLKVSLPKEHKIPSEDEYECILGRSADPFHVHIITR